MPDFPPAMPHGPFTELFPDVFVVQSSFLFAPLVTVNRNMIVLRQGGELTLLNAVRLTPEGEAALEALGTVRHIAKIGHYHNRDDAYVRDRYAATYWAPSPDAATTERLVDGAPGPVAAADVVVFEKAKSAEAALVLRQPQGGLLITCDSVQHWDGTRGCSLVGGLVLWQMGFLKRRATIGPIWSKELTDGAPAALRPDFERLLAKDFVHLVSGHGALLRDVARTELAATVEAVLR